MRISPLEIARALIDTTTTPGVDVDDACNSAIALLRRTSPGMTLRVFSRLVERELRRRGSVSSGMLVVPHEHSLKIEHIEPLLTKQAGKQVHMERKVEPELIGGTVLLVDHRRIDCSIQGALQALLKACLQPLN